MYLYSSAAPFKNMSVRPPRVLNSECLPYRGKPEKTQWKDMQEGDGAVRHGYFFAEDLEAVRAELFRQVFLPRVQRSHKCELKKLTTHLGKQETMDLDINNE